MLILIGGVYSWASQPVYRRRNEHDTPPPNWGNPAVYPGAQFITTETGTPCLASANNPIVPAIKGHFAATRHISFYVTAPGATVEDWYHARFTGEGWDYDRSIDAGDLTSHYITTGFWHYGWKINAPEFGPHFVMDVATGTTPTGLTSVELLLGDLDEKCWVAH